jgi:aryl-alcohol dehydrogenase-like predicted oxidoreductase
MRSRRRVPGIGTTKRHRLEENLGGAEVTLTAEDLARIGTRLDEIEIVGARYNAFAQARINR